MREFIGDRIQIDGRMIVYRLVTARDYLRAKGMSEEDADNFADYQDSTHQLLTQVIALKQACFLLRRTNYSCGSLSDGLFTLKMRLIHELREKHGFEFDDEFVERDGQPQKVCSTCNEPYVEYRDGSKRHGMYYDFGFENKGHAPTP